MNYMGLLFATCAAILWGLVYTFDQKILEKLHPITIMYLTALVTIVITLPYVIWNYNSIQKQLGKPDHVFLITLAIGLLVILANLFSLYGIKYLGASMSSVFEISYPFFIVLFSFLLWKTTLTPATWIGSLLIFAGSVVILKFG